MASFYCSDEITLFFFFSFWLVLMMMMEGTTIWSPMWQHALSCLALHYKVNGYQFDNASSHPQRKLHNGL